jgi:thiamine biosynthesis lipoprotein
MPVKNLTAKAQRREVPQRNSKARHLGQLGRRSYSQLIFANLCAFAPLRWVLIFSFAIIAGCTKPPAMYSQESYVFGTRVEVLVYGAPEDQARVGVNAVLREFDRMHRAYHAWQPSELTQLNEAIARGEQNIPVSDELAAMLKESQGLAEKSDELFDPAVGNLVELWGFHNDEFKPVLPDAGKLAQLVAEKPRMSDLSIVGKQVSSRNKAVALDLGGYAKGYALDKAAAILHGLGLKNALINIGGNVMALGAKGKEPWRVGIQNPRAATPLAVLEMKDGEAVGTSGDYQRYFELNGKRYCHILDPRTGQPSEGAEGVTVLIPPGPHAGMLSDATSKPLFVAGADQWLSYARRLGITAALRVDEKGVVYVTPAMHKRLSFTDKAVKVEEVGL